MHNADTYATGATYRHRGPALQWIPLRVRHIDTALLPPPTRPHAPPPPTVSDPGDQECAGCLFHLPTPDPQCPPCGAHHTVHPHQVVAFSARCVPVQCKAREVEHPLGTSSPGQELVPLEIHGRVRLKQPRGRALRGVQGAACPLQETACASRHDNRHDNGHNNRHKFRHDRHKNRHKFRYDNTQCTYRGGRQVPQPPWPPPGAFQPPCLLFLPSVVGRIAAPHTQRRCCPPRLPCSHTG